MTARALDLFLYYFSHMFICAQRKLWKDLYQKPGHPWLAGGDKENVFSNNMLKLYDFFPTVIYNYCKYEGKKPKKLMSTRTKFRREWKQIKTWI